MISCQEAVRQLWDYLEGDVEPTARADIDQHLAFCRWCCGEVAFAEELRGLLTAAGGQAQLPTRVADRLEETLDELDPPDDGRTTIRGTP